MNVSAQASGGQISRPMKNKQKTSTVNKLEKKRTSAQSGNRDTGMKQSQRERIIQNLINNMVYVEGGTYMMGGTSEQGSDVGSEEEPVHQVTLSSFSIGKYEVTQEEWEFVMGGNPSKSKGAKYPVEQVSWNDCQEFIQKLNAITNKRFRLPTEAEWEYASRGGKRGKNLKYAGNNRVNSVAWHGGERSSNSGNKIHAVGAKQANELGLYDMSGNVWEWCQDWHGNYGSDPQTNPVGPTSGLGRVIRGGSFNTHAYYCRVSCRYFRRDPLDRSSDLGLRLAL